jgi:hypothetical protein
MVKERQEGLKEQIGNGEFCGMLKKLGQYRQAYKDRWFVLQADKLWYFKTQEQARAITYIPLRDAVIKDSNDRPKRFGAALMQQSNSKLLTFEIITQERVFELVAPTPEEKKRWLQLLQEQTKLQVENDKIAFAEAEIEQHELKMAQRMEERSIQEHGMEMLDERLQTAAAETIEQELVQVGQSPELDDHFLAKELAPPVMEAAPEDHNHVGWIRHEHPPTVQQPWTEGYDCSIDAAEAEARAIAARPLPSLVRSGLF